MKTIDLKIMLSKDKTEKVIDFLLKDKLILNNAEQTNNLILISSRFYELKNHQENNLISIENYRVEKNKVRASLLSFIDKFDKVRLKNTNKKESEINLELEHSLPELTYNKLHEIILFLSKKLNEDLKFKFTLEIQDQTYLLNLDLSEKKALLLIGLASNNSDEFKALKITPPQKLVPKRKKLTEKVMLLLFFAFFLTFSIFYFSNGNENNNPETILENKSKNRIILLDISMSFVKMNFENAVEMIIKNDLNDLVFGDIVTLISISETPYEIFSIDLSKEKFKTKVNVDSLINSESNKLNKLKDFPNRIPSQFTDINESLKIALEEFKRIDSAKFNELIIYSDFIHDPRGVGIGGLDFRLERNITRKIDIFCYAYQSTVNNVDLSMSYLEVLRDSVNWNSFNLQIKN